MNNEKNVRNFYEIESQYEQSTLEVKGLIKKIVTIDIEMFNKKIESIDKDNKYFEFIDLFNAITGRKTNKYYFCKSVDDVKYSDLELNKVYKREELGVDLQSKVQEEKILELPARVQLANRFINLVTLLKEDFLLNLNKGDGFISTISSEIIIESDIEYLDNLIKYLQLIIDETGRLKILISEQEIYKEIEKNDQYNKKNALGKFFYRAFKKEKK